MGKINADCGNPTSVEHPPDAPKRPLDYLAPLNEQQRIAVEHGVGNCTPDAPGPLLIIAGAGSGKTNTLAYRVAHLAFSGADPQRMMLATFSRRSAAEMERRAGQILNRILGVASRRHTHAFPWSGTFHSIGARLLREYAPRVGLHASFSIHDRADSEDLIAIARHDLGFSATKNRFPLPATCLAIYSRSVNSQAPLAEVLPGAFPWCAAWESQLKTLFHAYVGAKQSQNVLDYDDLLLYWLQMVEVPALAREIGQRFDHILVDEYQDTNRLQEAILLAMKPDGMGVTVVGDDAQSIYSFRAATVRNILGFPMRFSPQARVVTLERNYRSTQPILDASNAVIDLAAERFTKNLWTDRQSRQKPQLVTVRDETDQARYVAERVLEYRESGVALTSQAVLFRSSSHSAQLELELARRDIPFVKYGGLKFLEAAHVKDVLCVLRWADNLLNRVAGFRATRIVRGVGAAIAARLLDDIAQAPDPMSIIDAFTVPTAVAGDWQSFAAIIRMLRDPTSDWPADIDNVIRWYEPQLDRIYEDAAARRADLVQLAQIAATYASRERFITEVTLDPPSATSDEAGPPGRDDDYLILSTIHSAKGQEWKSVHILNVVDGCIPSDMATGTSEEIEEERRLLYVAMTRAKEHLHLVVPQRFYVRQQSAYGDRHVHALRSRFLPSALEPLFDTCAWPVADRSTMADVASASDATATVDLAARARARASWM